MSQNDEFPFSAGFGHGISKEIEERRVKIFDEKMEYFFEMWKKDPKSEKILKQREAADKKFGEIFSAKNLNLLSGKDFVDFINAFGIDPEDTEKVISQMERLREAIAYLQDENVDLKTRLFEVLENRAGKYYVDGLSRKAVTSILQALFPDKYIVWTYDTQLMLRFFHVRPEKITDKFSDAYEILVQSAKKLEKRYRIPLLAADLLGYDECEYQRDFKLLERVELLAVKKAIETIDFKERTDLISQEEIDAIMDIVKRRFRDAVYYKDSLPIRALCSSNYSEGLIDALLYLGLAKAKWI